MDLNTLNWLLSSVMTTFKVLLWLIFVYYFVIAVFGWVRRREQPAENFSIKNRFAIIISAHNEERVIGGAIRSLKNINYPKEMYEIFVIADNCTDNTAKVAKETGAKVFERTDAIRRGKGYALEWMFEKLFAMEREFDAVCILDADNLVSKNFFMEMNKQLMLGHKVIQGYLDSKNPSDSWISGNYSISYWISNRLFQLPRYYLGFNCALGGTGFVTATSVLKEIGWGATCLTEDLEFSMRLVLKGMKVSWCHDAVVYDEKPLRMAQSWRQRKRWMQGHSDCATRYFKDLLKLAIRERSGVAFDSALYLIYPFIIVANGLAGLSALINILLFENIPLLLKQQETMIFVLLILFLTYASMIFILIEGKLSKKIALYFITFPLFSLTWIPIIIAGFIDRNKREWEHTLHTRALDIHDLEEIEVEKVG